MTTTATATEAIGLVVMLEAAGRTIAQLEQRLEHVQRHHAAELGVEREHNAELAARLAQLEEHAATLAHTDGEQLVTSSDGAPREASVT